MEFSQQDRGANLLDEFCGNIRADAPGPSHWKSLARPAAESFALRQFGGQFRLGARHQRGRIGASNRQRNRAFFALLALASSQALCNFFRFAGYHELARTIQVGQDDARRGADFARRSFVQADNGGHAAFG